MKIQGGCGRIFIFNFTVFIFNSPVNIKVEHIAIPSPNPAALKSWYERVLGAKEVFNNGQNPPTCLISLGNIWFEIYAAEKSLPDTANNKLAGFRHLALRVDSLDAAKAELEKRGVKFTEAERQAAGGGRILFFVDCEGNLLHLVERTNDSKLK
jgi:glyoxylase I family protein